MFLQVIHATNSCMESKMPIKGSFFRNIISKWTKLKANLIVRALKKSLVVLFERLRFHYLQMLSYRGYESCNYRNYETGTFSVPSLIVQLFQPFLQTILSTIPV